MAEFSPKYTIGAKVLINKNVAGIVLSSYNMFKNERSFIYRVIVDANELCYRVKSNHIDQTDRKDLLAEDFKSLLFETKFVGVMEIAEENLTPYNK